MNRDFILEWIDLNGEQLSGLEYAMDVIGCNPRAKELYGQEIARLASDAEIHGPAADMSELSGLFGGRPYLFTLAALMGRLPWLVEQYKDHGIDEAALRAVLRDVNRWMKVCRQVHGYWGIAEYSWLARAFRFRLFEIGSLQYIANTLPMHGVADCPGMPVLEVHVPEGTDLSAAAVTASMQAAPLFFERHFGIQPKRLVCGSWLLDPALQQILPGSRVAEFGRRFTLTCTESSGQTIERVFGFDVKDYRTAPRDTRLQRAVAEWLDAGNECREGIGYISIDSSATE